MNQHRFILYLIPVLSALLLTACDSSSDSAGKADDNQPQNLPLYQVKQAGLDRKAAMQLSRLLLVKESLLKGALDTDGRLALVDDKRHLALPVKSLGSEKDDEDKQSVMAEALKQDALKGMALFPTEKAHAIFLSALKDSDLLLEGKPRSRHNWLILMDEQGQPLSKTAINTRVDFDLSLSGKPLQGPGAKLSISFSGEGEVTQLKYAARQLEAGETLPLLTIKQAKERCAELFKRQNDYEQLNVSAQLFYFAPALSEKGVKTVLPHYRCGGEAMMSGQKLALLEQTIPATEDLRYVPSVALRLSQQGTDVSASLKVEGGAAPYRIRWSAPSFGTQEGSQSELKYSAQRRDEEAQEWLTVSVTDSNGISVTTAQRVDLSEAKPLAGAAKQLAGVRDYGSENAVLNQFGGLDQGFRSQMEADGVGRRFAWAGLAAWEQDFKAPQDSNWIDNSDISFYVGHGGVGHFTFENDHQDDALLASSDASGSWGDKDLEWLALYSCQVLGRGADGQEPFRNWKQAFAGLHLLLGFDSNAAVSDGFSGEFAHNLLVNNMTLRNAWFEAIDEYQPNDRIGIVMGVLRADDAAWNYNDHFHGKGSVGPDIRGAQIGLGWYVTGP